MAIIADPEVVLKMTEARGYRNISPDNGWAEWCDFKVRYKAFS